MDRMFRGIGRTVVHHRRKVVAVWVVFLVAGLIFAPQLSKVFNRAYTSGSPGEAQRAADVMNAEFRNGGAFQEQLVFSSTAYTVNDPRYRDAAEGLIGRLQGAGLVKGVTSFFSTGDGSLVSADRRTTVALLDLKATTHLGGTQAAKTILGDVAAAPKPRWLTADTTGIEAIHSQLTTAGQQAAQKAEQVAFPVAIVVLIVVFGALAAAVLPLLLGALSIVLALALAFAVGQFMDLDVILETLAVSFGLALGIDYSLFMLTRYRDERKAGRDVPAAAVETVTHAGKAIAFSGLAVLIGLAALIAARDGTLNSAAIGGMLAVVVALSAGLTLLPAVITLLGDRIDKPRTLARFLSRTQRGGLWHRWATHVIRRPVRYLVLGAAIMGTLAFSALSLKLGSLGASELSANYQSRQGYQTLAKEFGPGAISPVQFVIRSGKGVGNPQIIAGVDRLTKTIQADPRFAGAMSITTVVPSENLAGYQALYASDFANVPTALTAKLAPMVNLAGDRTTTVVQGFLKADPQTPQAWAIVRDVRKDIVPAVPQLRGAEVLVGGNTALEADSVTTLYSRFPIILGFVLTATFLMLMVLLRSILIPLKAVVLNLLSVAAAYGALVLVFQKGLGQGVFGFTSTGTVSYMTPLTLFAILFGLSMDYEVFLMSRIRELHDRGYPNDEAVALGLEQTGRVITGAAAIMIIVFSGFLRADILMIKEIGFGFAAAVLLDATIVRVLLVPAVMRLLGERAWWLPGWLARILPKAGPGKDVATTAPAAPKTPAQVTG